MRKRELSGGRNDNQAYISNARNDNLAYVSNAWMKLFENLQRSEPRTWRGIRDGVSVRQLRYAYKNSEHLLPNPPGRSFEAALYWNAERVVSEKRSRYFPHCQARES